MEKRILQKRPEADRHTMFRKVLTGILVCCLILQLPVFQVYADTSTPLQMNGQLKVKGTKLVKSSGKTVTLKGVSTHGINWFPQYVNKFAFKTLRDQWGVNCIRLAMYMEEYNGYCSGSNQGDLKKIINNDVKYATELGMYVIIDWHILSNGNPKKNQKQVVAFFKEMAKKYKNQKNIFMKYVMNQMGILHGRPSKATPQQ